MSSFNASRNSSPVEGGGSGINQRCGRFETAWTKHDYYFRQGWNPRKVKN
jgi:hypothetical protein